MTRITDIPELEGYGVFVDDIDFKNLSLREWKELGQLHLQKLVMVIRKSGLKNKKVFYKVLSKWGEHRQNYAAILFDKYPWAEGKTDNIFASSDVPQEEKEYIKEFFRIGGVNPKEGNILKVTGAKKNGYHVGLFGHGDLLWHSNECGDLAFTPGVALLGQHGMTKSATGFMVTTPYYYSVSDSIRSELDEMVLTHNFVEGKINANGENNIVYKNMCPFPNTEIPMVIQSPAGIKGLHYSFNTVTGSNNDRLLAEVRKGLEKYTYDYWWENDDDLLIFDNTIVQHRRLGDTTDRLCLRYQFDYTYLHEGLYQPYLQEPYITRYTDRVQKFHKLLQHEKPCRK
jgi:alpha-ketoglutarate-dependent taurine dioxygenase